MLLQLQRLPLALKQSKQGIAQPLHAGAVALDKLRAVRNALKHFRRVLAERGNGVQGDATRRWFTHPLAASLRPRNRSEPCELHDRTWPRDSQGKTQSGPSP